jgi:hypothetical protein
MNPTLNEIFFWALSVPIILFPILYAILASWHKSGAGRQTMTLSLGLAGLVLLGVLRRIFGAGYPGHSIVMFSVYVLLGAALWWQVGYLLHIQLIERNRKRRQREWPHH